MRGAWALATLVLAAMPAEAARPRVKQKIVKPAKKQPQVLAAPAPEAPTIDEPTRLPVSIPSPDRVAVPATPIRRRWTISANPLPIIAGRYGLNVEYVLIRHHGLIASAWLQTFTRGMLRVIMPDAIDVSRGADSRVGGELGYRFYSGHDGANGFFAGLSGVAIPFVYPRVTPDFKSEVVSFHAYGGAIDIGFQAVVDPGFTIGGGIGVMALAYTPPGLVKPPPGVDPPSYPEPHVLPRLLLSAGWSF